MMLLAVLFAAVTVIKTPQPPQFSMISADGALLAAAAKDSLRLYRIADGTLVREWKDVTAFAFFPQSDRMALGYGDGRLRIVRIADGSELQSVTTPVRIDGILVADDGKRLAFVNTLTAGGRPFLWTIGAAAPVPLPGPEIGVVEDAAFSPDGALIALAGDDTTITIASTADGHLVARVDSLDMAVFALAFSRDGKRLYAGGAAREVMIFDTATWKLATKFPAEENVIVRLEVSPDGKRLAASERPPAGGDAPGMFVVWDVSGAAPHELLRERNALGAASRFAPSGKFVYASNGEGGVHVMRMP